MLSSQRKRPTDDGSCLLRGRRGWCLSLYPSAHLVLSRVTDDSAWSLGQTQVCYTNNKAGKWEVQEFGM